MFKFFPSQVYFDSATEERYTEWIFKKTRIFIIATYLLVLVILVVITSANIYISGYELVRHTVLYVRLLVILVCILTIVSFIWLDAIRARKVLFWLSVVFTLAAFLDTYFWVGKVRFFTPEAQMITMYMFMIVPFLNVEHKIITGFLVIMGLVVCWYIYRVDVFWSLLYSVLMYVINIVVYYRFDILLRVQFQTICKEQDKSNIDLLTGVYSKNALFTLFWEEIVSLQDCEKIIVGLLDIDCFKLYNDTYGHVAGDKILRQVAQALLSFGFDKVYRFGGEEFIFTLKRNTQNISKIPNVCGVLEDLNIPHESSSVSQYLTASIGLVTVRRDKVNRAGAADFSLEKVIAVADENLYKAKTSGRNKAVVAEEPLVF